MAHLKPAVTFGHLHPVQPGVKHCFVVFAADPAVLFGFVRARAKRFGQAASARDQLFMLIVWMFQLCGSVSHGFTIRPPLPGASY